MACIEIPGERVPTWRFAPDDLPSEFDSPVSELTSVLASAGYWPLFRGVSIDRYPAIVNRGVDADPTDTAIFCTDDLFKALEYTMWPPGQRAGAVMIFRGPLLLRSFKILPDTASVEETEAVRRDYPHFHDDGTTRWWSRVQNSAAFGYEEAYGYWIPGDPFDALAAVLLVGDIAEHLDWAPQGDQSHVGAPSDSASPPA